MTTFELEVAAYAAAHRIYNGLGQPDRVCPGGYRSRMIDRIADAIKESFSVHHAYNPALPPPTRGHGWITGTADVDALDAGDVPRCSDCKIPVGGQHRPSCHRQGLVTPDSDYGASGLQQTRYWRELRHAFDNHGVVSASMFTDRPCLKCGMTPNFENHFSPSGEFLQPMNVEPAACDEAAKSE